jgi:nitrate/nitrite transport system ATP-binding protein
VANTLPRTRTRNQMHHHPNYYGLRNHLLDFLVNRSLAPPHRRAGDAANETFEPIPEEETR